MRPPLTPRLSFSALPLLATLLLSGCFGEEAELAAPAAPAAPARAVHVALPEAGPATPPVSASGVVAFRDETRLSFVVGGLIRDIGVREGAAVSAGQVLATLEPTQVDAGATQAREAWLKAQRDLDRGRKLLRDDVLTREQLDDLGTAEKVARAALSAAEFSRGHARIVAPASGHVLRRLAEAREIVAPGQPVLIVGEAAKGLVLRLGLADRDVVRVRPGDPAQLQFGAFPGRGFTGKVQEVSQATDPRSGTYRVDIAFEGGDAGFVSGLIGRAEIRGSGSGDAPLQYIPLTALVEGAQDNALVFLLPPGGRTVKAAKVQVAFIAGDRAALRTPLPAATPVVTDGAAYLHDGEAVDVVDEAESRS